MKNQKPFRIVINRQNDEHAFVTIYNRGAWAGRFVILARDVELLKKALEGVRDDDYEVQQS